jgi:hypothetical protein
MCQTHGLWARVPTFSVPTLQLRRLAEIWKQNASHDHAFSGCNMTFVLQARSLQLVGSVLNTSNWMSYVPARQVSQPAFCMHV